MFAVAPLEDRNHRHGVAVHRASLPYVAPRIERNVDSTGDYNQECCHTDKQPQMIHSHPNSNQQRRETDKS